MRFDLPELTTVAFQTDIVVRWADMDALGHVNNVLYFRYLEEIRMQWLAGINALPDPNGKGPVLVNAFCTYHRQVVYPAVLSGKLFLGKKGRSSIDIFCTLTDKENDKILYASGGATVVWRDFVAGVSISLPDSLGKTGF
jgi:acyl-CoA thioester hydrolase